MTVSLLTDQSLPADVLADPGIVVVDVWAEWCTPCRALVPIFERLSSVYEGRVRFLKLDADANPETVSRFAVRALPTILLFKAGELVDRVVGAQAMASYVTAIDRQLDPSASAVVPPPTVRVAARGATADATELLSRADATLVFKHSNSCPVSFRAKRQFDAFVEAYPDIPTRLVVVQQERDLSNALEAASGVRHESPQALIVRDGQVLFDASHGDITTTRLAEAFTKFTRPSTLP